MGLDITPDHCRERLEVAAGGMDRIEGWFINRTFRVEAQAEAAVRDWGHTLASVLAELRTLGADDETLAQWEAGFVKKWLAFQHAGSRTLNWMITGPSRFPVARNEKRMATERKRGDELDDYVRRAIPWFQRRNNAAKRAAISAAAKEAGVNHEEREVAGVRIIKNTALDRVQLIFPGKPDPEMIANLKKSAFRWSPREGAWQRQLTRNGVWAAEGILAGILADKEN